MPKIATIEIGIIHAYTIQTIEQKSISLLLTKIVFQHKIHLEICNFLNHE